MLVVVCPLMPQGAGAVFKRLLEADADPRAVDGNGQNVLHLAARAGAGPRFVDNLIEAWEHSGGAAQAGTRHKANNTVAVQPQPTHARDKWGRTPLLWAVQNGHFNAVQALLAHSSDANARDDQGETPLQVAERRAQCRADDRPHGLRPADFGAIATLLGGNAKTVRLKDTVKGET